MERKQCEEQTLVAEEKGTLYVWDPTNWNNTWATASEFSLKLTLETIL